jgi:hypothetical protein
MVSADSTVIPSDNDAEEFVQGFQNELDVLRKYPLSKETV